jgi:acyl-CoA synthetase (NDP forming)
LASRTAPAEALDLNAHATWVEYPVAVKILSAQVPHKSDAGGVVLGVRDAAGLREAIVGIRGRVEAAMPGVKAERFLVQAMAQGMGEALVGFATIPRWDRS